MTKKNITSFLIHSFFAAFLTLLLDRYIQLGFALLITVIIGFFWERYLQFILFTKAKKDNIIELIAFPFGAISSAFIQSVLHLFVK